MKIAFFSTKQYDRLSFNNLNKQYGFQLDYFEEHLNPRTAKLAEGYQAVCAFVNDTIDTTVLSALHKSGTRLIALRSAGFNNVDLACAKELNIKIVRVPAYSPYAVAEHTLALILALNRKTHKAYNRVREGNFSLDGLMGFDLNGKTAGIIGTGKIGIITGKILQGFGCRVLAYDIHESKEAQQLGFEYVKIDELYKRSDIVSLHCPLTPETYHIVNGDSLGKMKQGVMLINTGRGGLVDTPAMIEALKTGKVGYLGLDVYEEEADLFFEDYSNQVIRDDVFARLLTFPNVIITGHQAFFTSNALTEIAETTLSNIKAFDEGKELINEVKIG